MNIGCILDIPLRHRTKVCTMYNYPNRKQSSKEDTRSAAPVALLNEINCVVRAGQWPLTCRLAGVIWVVRVGVRVEIGHLALGRRTEGWKEEPTVI